MNELKNRIREICDQVHVIQLATAVNNQPWCCNVHTFIDDDFAFYWVSRLDRRHSQEIAANPQVGAASALHTSKPLVGLQVAGTATLVSDPAEVKRVMEKYGAHNGSSREWLDDIISGRNPHKLYRLTPSRIAIFDQVHYADDPQQIWDMTKSA